MKIIFAFLVLFTYSLHASQFFLQKDLDHSLENVPPAGTAVGTFFAIGDVPFKATNQTCVAIGKRDVLTNRNFFNLVDFNSCFVLIPDSRLQPYAVAEIFREPTAGKLVILELSEDMHGISPLPLGLFTEKQ